jgi:uncharacterized membrane protein YhaH (DUF805 family)
MSLLVRASERIGKFGFWRTVVNFWTLAFFAAIVYDFLTKNSLDQTNVILTVSAIYCAALAIYSAEKEFRRWHRSHEGLHPGELYALLWTVLVVAVLACKSIFAIEYRMPPEVSASYIAVITILAITRESKNAHKRRGSKRNG